MKKVIIGVHGKIGSGKDTLADYLVKSYGFVKYSFAEPLKCGIQVMFGFSDTQMFDRDEREKELVDFPGWSVRSLLQYVGTELFRDMIDKDIWIKTLGKEVSKSKNNRIVISDVRFPGERFDLYKYVDADFKLSYINILRDVEGSVGIQGHESEGYTLDCDHIITNNGTIDDMYTKTDIILQVLGLR